MCSLICATGERTSVIPLTVAVSLINATLRNRLRNALSRDNSERHALLHIEYKYRVQSAALETDRCRCLLRSEDALSVHLYYDNAHMSILSRLEMDIASCVSDNVIWTSDLCVKAPPPPPSDFVEPCPRRTIVKRSKRGANTHAQLPDIAVSIMTSWYQANREHPYPSYAASEVIASRGGNISVEQVKKWFANKRMRNRNTKTLAQIALRRVRKC